MAKRPGNKVIISCAITGSIRRPPNVFMRLLPVIKQSTDAVINITTGGGRNMTVEERG
jgi:3,5-dioxohexanoate:acetyl-CoA acetone transferase